MSPRPKKSKLTVQFKPLNQEGFFDIKAPESQKSAVPTHVSEVVEEKQAGWWAFFGMAFSIFLVFAGLGLAMNAKDIISINKNIAFAGYESLKEGATSLANQDFERASVFFEGAESSFEELQQNTSFLTAQANQYLKSNLYLDTAQKLIESGMGVSKISQELTQLLSDVRSIPMILTQQNLHDNQSVQLTGLINTQKGRLQKIQMEASLLKKNLATLNANTLPKDLREKLEIAQAYISQFVIALNEVDQNFEAVLTLLGDKTPHRYLVLFQNNHEIRATGGFIGSYALVDVNDGAITKIDVKDVYETDGQLTEFVPPPPGINRVADQLYLRDSNYSPDFPTSAQKIMWFLEHSRGPTVDTVVAIDQTVAEKLLALTGPVVVPSFPFALRADNFNDLLSYNIEAKLSKTYTPKQVLIDLIPLFKDRLLSLNDFSSLNDLAHDLITSRHIQVYSDHANVQTLVEKLHLDGRLVATEPDMDFLSVVTTSIGGNKSDAFIKTNLSHHTEVGSMGMLTDHLIIQKRHTWDEGDFTYWQKLMDRYGTGKVNEATLRFIHGAGDNLDYMRVYVPKGSLLIGLEGVDIEALDSYEELGYTVFAFTFGPVSAGGMKEVKLSYKLPFEIKTENPMDVYRFIAQKQAGTENVTLTKSLQTSGYLQVLESYPPVQNSAFTLYPQYETALDSNKIFLSAIGLN